ncbi:MAG: DUF3568 family protein [Nitrospiraceae bacterium]|nr:DUF3568 family protein [Nitrospiraceae bacterium]
MKTERFKAYLMLISGLCALTVLAACAAVVAGGALGAGSVVYVNGELSQKLNKPVSKVYDATIAALNDFKLPVLENTHDKLSARLKSRLSSGEEVSIKIDSVTSSSSKIGIRVGTIGDKDKSRTILDRIDEHLK